MSFFGPGGNLLMKPVDRLSQLIIDADKDWNAKGITNILEAAAMMSKGDLIFRDDAVLARLQAGPPGYVLTSAGPGLAPTWAPAGGALRYYYPAVFRGIIAETVHVGPDLSLPVNARHATSHAQATGDDPADLIKQKSPALASSLATTLHAAPDASLAASARYKAAMSILVDGFVEETALAVQTDHTAQARDATANDLNLSPMSDTVLDKVYIGSNYKFWQAQIQVAFSASLAVGDQVLLLNPAIAAAFTNPVSTIPPTTPGTATLHASVIANWQAAEQDLLTLGVVTPGTAVSINFLGVGIQNLAGNITIRMYCTINGTERRIYPIPTGLTFSVAADAPCIPVINGSMALPGRLRVTVQSDNAADNGLAVTYEVV